MTKNLSKKYYMFGGAGLLLAIVDILIVGSVNSSQAQSALEDKISALE